VFCERLTGQWEKDIRTPKSEDPCCRQLPVTGTAGSWALVSLQANSCPPASALAGLHLSQRGHSVERALGARSSFTEEAVQGFPMTV